MFVYVLAKTVFWRQQTPAPLPSSAGSSLASAAVPMAHLSFFKEAVGSAMFLP